MCVRVFVCLLFIYDQVMIISPMDKWKFILFHYLLLLIYV